MGTKEADAANELWRRHTKDEAAALEGQQFAAGMTHRPVEGPPPYGNEEVNSLAAEILGRERERCARIVESWPVDNDAGAAKLLARVAAALRQIDQ